MRCYARFVLGIAVLSAEAVVLRQLLAVLENTLGTRPAVPHPLFAVLVEVENPFLDAGEMHELVALLAVPDRLDCLDSFGADHAQLLRFIRPSLDIRLLPGFLHARRRRHASLRLFDFLLRRFGFLWILSSWRFLLLRLGNSGFFQNVAWFSFLLLHIWFVKSVC